MIVLPYLSTLFPSDVRWWCSFHLTFKSYAITIAATNVLKTADDRRNSLYISGKGRNVSFIQNKKIDFLRKVDSSGARILAIPLVFGQHCPLLK